MKKFFHTFFAVMVILAVGLFVSCEEEQKWGFEKIYIPQSVMEDGGLTNIYSIPNNNSAANNYALIDEYLDITLGVYRSGEAALDAYSVDIYVDDAATGAATGQINRGVVLPKGYYSLPAKVDVPSGSRQAIFKLRVDIERIIADYPTYNKSRLLLVCGIRNPSRYELNEQLSTVTVAIEGSVFMPTIPIIKGGDFDQGSAQHWTIVNLNNRPFELIQIDENEGQLLLSVDDYTQYGGDSRFMCYQKLNSPDLEVGKTYNLSASIYVPAQDFVSTGGTREMDLALALFPGNASMNSSSLDYKPGDTNYWYMDSNMDSGKPSYPLATGTAGFVPFTSIRNNNARPLPGMQQGDFTMDEIHLGGYVAVYVRLRNACKKVETIRIDQLSITEK